MLRRLFFSAAWLVLITPAVGEEKYTFSLDVKTGDVFEVQNQLIYSESAEGESQSVTLRLGDVLTVAKMKDGHVQQIDSRRTKWEQDGTDLFRMWVVMGKPPGTVRYDWIEGKYKPRLLDGNLTPDIAQTLKQSHWDPFIDGLLPSEPLAVGETERVEGLRRLTVIGLPVDDLMNDPREPVVTDKPATITLQKVEEADGSRTAFLTVGCSVHTEKKFELSKGVRIPAKITYDATVIYDLDRRFITQAEVKFHAESPGEARGKKVLGAMDVVQVTRFEKQKPNP